MGKRVDVPTQTIEQLKHQYLKNEKSLKELSILHNLSITKIRNLLLANKVKLRKTGTHNYITSDGKKVRELHTKIIKAYKSGESLRKVANNFNVSYQTVSNILAVHTVSRRNKGSYGKLTDKQKNLICTQYKTTSIKDLAEKFEVSGATILKLLKAAGIEIVHGRKYKLNQEVFDELNSTNAYWLGFLYARGNIKSQNHFDIYFHNSMTPIVEQFRSFLMSNQPFLTVHLYSKNTNKEYNLNRLAISSTKLVNKLAALGVNKVSEIKYPKDITKNKLDQEFISGYFDGCGQLVNSRTEPYIQLRSNMSFLNTLNKIIIQNAKGKLQCEIIPSSFNTTYGKLIYTGKENITQVLTFLKRTKKDEVDTKS